MPNHALILSSDISLINQVNEMLLSRNMSVYIEKSRISSIWSVLMQDVEFMVIDIDSFSEENIDYIKIIKKIRPKLPLVVLSQDNSVESHSKLKEMGIFYISIKPVDQLEFSMVIDAVKLLHTKKSDTLVSNTISINPD